MSEEKDKDKESSNWTIKTGREKEVEREKRRIGGTLSYLSREDYIFLIKNLLNIGIQNLLVYFLIFFLIL